jgi:anti-sigma B factor antagonist
MGAFTFFTESIPQVHAMICRVRGYWDFQSSNQLEALVWNLVKQGQCRLLFEFSELSYLNSQGLGTLMNMQKTLEKKAGGVLIIAPSESVRNVFRLTGFDRAIQVYPSVEEAILNEPMFKQL